MKFASVKAEGKNYKNPATWISRFAPTPSGYLHFGSLVSVLAVALDSHAHAGEWVLRFDDSDRLRIREQARASIVHDLDSFGFSWSNASTIKSDRNETYFKIAQELVSAGLAYACDCSRTDIASRVLARNNYPRVYPGTCRNLGKEPAPDRAIRIRVPNQIIRVIDRWYGPIDQNLMESVGDFVIWRRDSVPSYHLTTVLDDANTGIGSIVRGCDLINSTLRQVYLQRLLGLPTPSYAHHPIVTLRGQKMGKSTGARRLNSSHASRSLSRALRFLGQSPPPTLETASVDEVWFWARENWQECNIRARILKASV